MFSPTCNISSTNKLLSDDTWDRETENMFSCFQRAANRTYNTYVCKSGNDQAECECYLNGAESWRCSYFRGTCNSDWNLSGEEKQVFSIWIWLIYWSALNWFLVCFWREKYLHEKSVSDSPAEEFPRIRRWASARYFCYRWCRERRQFLSFLQKWKRMSKFKSCSLVGKICYQAPQADDRQLFFFVEFFSYCRVLAFFLAAAVIVL